MQIDMSKKDQRKLQQLFNDGMSLERYHYRINWENIGISGQFGILKLDDHLRNSKVKSVIIDYSGILVTVNYNGQSCRLNYIFETEEEVIKEFKKIGLALLRSRGTSVWKAVSYGFKCLNVPMPKSYQRIFGEVE